MGQGEFLNINFFTALFTLINTITLFLVLKKFLWGPVMKMIADRQQEIDDMYADAGSARDQAQQMQAEYESRLADAHQTGERIIKEAMQRGHERQEDIIRQANADAEALLRKAAEDAASEKKKAINDAKDEIAGIAMEVTRKIVGHKLDGEDHAVLVDKFIEQLGEGV